LILLVVGAGVFVGLVYVNRGPACAQPLRKMMEANRPGLGANRVMLAAVTSLSLALLFAVVIPASPTLYTRSDGGLDVQMGMWTVAMCNGDACVETGATNAALLPWLYAGTDCAEAIVSKLETCQAFTILGAFALAAAIGLLFSPVPSLPWAACGTWWPARLGKVEDAAAALAAAAAAFASFCYLVIFAVAAGIYHGEAGKIALNRAGTRRLCSGAFAPVCTSPAWPSVARARGKDTAHAQPPKTQRVPDP